MDRARNEKIDWTRVIKKDGPIPGKKVRVFGDVILPPGVEVRGGEGYSDSRRLVIGIRFKYRKVRCRELALSAAPDDAAQSVEDAVKALAQVKRSIDLGDFKYGRHFKDSSRAATFGEIVESGVTIKKLVDDYFATPAMGKLCESTLSQYGKGLAIYVEKQWYHQTADKLTIPAILEWLEEIAAKGTVSVSTIRGSLTPLQGALDNAVLKQKIALNPFKQISLSKIWGVDEEDSGEEQDLEDLKEKIFAFTDADMALMIAASPAKVRAMLTFWYWTGFRPSELIALRWEDIDWAKNRIRARRVRSMGKIRKKMKTKSSNRWVALHGPALAALKTQQAATKLKGHGFIWEHPEYDAPWTGSAALAWQWEKWIAKAGVAHRSPRQMRHSFACKMIREREPIETISKMLGHKHPGITREFYLQMIEEFTPENMHGFLFLNRYTADGKKIPIAGGYVIEGEEEKKAA